jgi:hypothetical protein
LVKCKESGVLLPNRKHVLKKKIETLSKPQCNSELQQLAFAATRST